MRLLLPLARRALALAGSAASEGHHHHHPVLTDEEWTIYICIVAALVLLAGLMSGLTLGLMSIDVLDMEASDLPLAARHVPQSNHLSALLS